MNAPNAEEPDSLHWHALNFRTAASSHAESMWRKLDAFLQRQRELSYALGLAEGLKLAAEICDAMAAATDIEARSNALNSAANNIRGRRVAMNSSKGQGS